MLNMNTIGFVHVVWAHNEERLKTDPPFRCVPGNVDTGDPSLDQLQMDSEDRRARRYDYYRDIKSISLLVRQTPEDRDTHPLHFVTGSDSEYDMLSSFWDYMRTHYVSMIAGWNLVHCAFPLIVGKALQHGIPVPSAYMPNPFKKFQDPALCELSTLYTQCSFQKARPLPDLNDIGSWWGLPTDNALPPVSALKLASLSDEDMVAYGYGVIDRSLQLMADMLVLYDRLTI